MTASKVNEEEFAIKLRVSYPDEWARAQEINNRRLEAWLDERGAVRRAAYFERPEGSSYLFFKDLNHAAECMKQFDLTLAPKPKAELKKTI